MILSMIIYKIKQVLKKKLLLFKTINATLPLSNQLNSLKYK